MTGSSSWNPILRRRGIPVVFYSLINQGYEDAYYQELLGLPGGLGRHRYADGWVIVHEEDANQFTSHFLPLLQHRSFVDFFALQCRRAADELLDFGGAVHGRDFSAAPTAEILLAFSRLSSLSVRVMPFLNTMVFVQDDIETRLRERLGARWDMDPDAPELSARMQALMTGGGMESLAARSLKELGALAASLAEEAPDLVSSLLENEIPQRGTVEKRCPAFSVQAEEYLAKYDFFGTDYFVGEPIGFDDLLRQLGVHLGKSSEEQQAEPLDPKLLAALDEEDLSLLRTAQTMQFLREYRLEALFKSGRDCRSLFLRIGDTLGLGFDELVCLSFREILSSLAAEVLCLDFETIEQRRAGFGCDSSEVVVGERLGQLLDDLPNSYSSDNRVITGVTAFPGESTGALRVVDHLSKVEEVEVGDILAAPMTMPYHVPAMARAGAILTDEGGILSHAAIVARELQVPCVVGLATATSAFPPGTNVHVSAVGSTGRVERVE